MIRKKPRSIVTFRIATLALLVLYISQCKGADWPMWRYDSARSGVTLHGIPVALHLNWQRELPASEPAWPATQQKLQFDRAPNPIVAGQNLYITSNVNDSLTAYSTRSGKRRWRFFADGPIRFAPVATKDRIFFVSDDGHLYCLSNNGELIWKKNGGPARRFNLGNDRLISAWPARGGPVLHDGSVYFAASIWPFMGIFIHAVDAETGETIWTNSGDGSNLTAQPHGPKSFATVAPQGHLAIGQDRLMVPGGRSIPAVYDLATGKLLHFRYDNKHGGHNVFAGNDQYFVNNVGYDLKTGNRFDELHASLFDGDSLLGTDDSKLIRYGMHVKTAEKITKNRIGLKKIVKVFTRDKSEQELDDSLDRLLIKTGDIIWASRKNELIEIDVANPKKVLWRHQFDAPVWDAIAADDRLFVVTQDQCLYCFAETKPTKVVRHQKTTSRLAAEKSSGAIADEILDLVSMKGVEGYALCLGVPSANLVAKIVEHAKIHLIVLDERESSVNRFRAMLEDANINASGNSRVHAIVGDLRTCILPDYFASCIFSESKVSLNSSELKSVSRMMRPFGGFAMFRTSEGRHAAIQRILSDSPDFQGQVHRIESWTLFSRPKPLPGTDNWTHQYANSAQTSVSQEDRVKTPLGILWFGGVSHAGTLPRHGHGPAPQVAGGRLFLEGPDLIRAIDVYTGRLLWETKLPGIGKFYDETKHLPGAGEIGSNYVSTSDHVYVAYGDKILALDAGDGSTPKEISLANPIDHANWGHISVSDEFLIATSTPVAIRVEEVEEVEEKLANEKQHPAQEIELRGVLDPTRYASGSLKLVVFNRRTGEELWQRHAEFNFRHNAICSANGRLFCIDRFSDVKVRTLQRRGIYLKESPTIYAFDLATGNEIWRHDQNVFGTFLSYSAKHDILIQGGSLYRDRAADEAGKGLVAHSGSTGEILWSQPDLLYNGPVLLFDDRIISNGTKGFEIDWTSGEKTGWNFDREYGCNTAHGCRNLLTFRSGAAGFYDLLNDAGTGNFGGFRSSCTNNLIPANGVLSAPDYTRTCNCAYQNQTSLALVHMPEMDSWTFGAKSTGDRLAINFGAPGDRSLSPRQPWYEFPIVGGESPELQLKVTPESPAIYRHHSSSFAGKFPWIAASGLVGVENIKVTLQKKTRYQVRLYFAEPTRESTLKRVFDVSLNGKRALTDFDIAENAGESRKLFVASLEVESNSDGDIEVSFHAKSKALPVLSGIEFIRP